MAEVWLAEDLRLSRWVAVKILAESLHTSEDGELTESIQREARTIAGLQHPNIVGVYDTGSLDGRSYLVMEYVQGHSVRELLDSMGRLPEAEAIRYGQQIAAALHFAHQQGVVHCDVKPENILINEQGVAKVADFGVADQVTRTLTPDQAREVLGTIAYLAPEVLQGTPATPASDIYSLGLTVFEMVTGQLPFTGATPALVAAQRLANPAPSLSSVMPGASPALEAALDRALATQPSQRFGNADEFRQALIRAGQGIGRSTSRVAPIAAPVAAAPPPPPPRRPNRTGPIAYDDGEVPARGSNVALMVAIIGVIVLAIGVAAIAIALAAGGGDGDGGVGDSTPTVSPTVEATEEATATEEPTEIPTPEPTLTPVPTETPTEEPTATPTEEPTETPTPEPTDTPEPTATPEPTDTPEAEGASLPGPPSELPANAGRPEDRPRGPNQP